MHAEANHPTVVQAGQSLPAIFRPPVRNTQAIFIAIVIVVLSVGLSRRPVSQFVSRYREWAVAAVRRRIQLPLLCTL